MSRISIDVTPKEHQKLKALAALQGKSIKEYVLECTLGADSGGQDAIAELDAILDERIREAEAGGISKRTVEEIFQEAYRKANDAPAPDA